MSAVPRRTDGMVMALGVKKGAPIFFPSQKPVIAPKKEQLWRKICYYAHDFK
jgi:hypothetical protein